MADPLIRPNSTHILAVLNESGHAPEVGDLNNPSVHLSTDAFGNLLVTGVGGATSNVTVINGPGAAAVNIQDGGNTLTVDGAVSQVQADVSPTQLIKLVAATGTPEPLAVNGTFFKTATLIANKAARTPNATKAWLGVTAGDGTQPIGLDPGVAYTLTAPEGQRFDLNDFYLDVTTNGDGVVVIYS